MIEFLLFLRDNWKLALALSAIGFSFVSGYHLRSVQEVSRAEKEMVSLVEHNNKLSQDFEKKAADITFTYNNIDTRLTYENDDNCFISTDSLRILVEATKSSR